MPSGPLLVHVAQPVPGPGHERFLGAVASGGPGTLGPPLIEPVQVVDEGFVGRRRGTTVHGQGTSMTKPSLFSTSVMFLRFLSSGNCVRSSSDTVNVMRASVRGSWLRLQSRKRNQNAGT